MIKYLCHIIFFLLFTSCKSETKSDLENNINIIAIENSTKTSFQDSIINAIDKKLVGKKIIENKEIENLKLIYKKSLERDVEKPYMWDVFISSNDTLMEFYN